MIRSYSRQSTKYSARLSSTKKKISSLINRSMSKRKKTNKIHRNRVNLRTNLNLLKKRGLRKKVPKNINGPKRTIVTCRISTVYFLDKNSPKNILLNWTNFRKDPFSTSKRTKVCLWLLTRVLVKQLLLNTVLLWR